MTGATLTAACGAAAVAAAALAAGCGGDSTGAGTTTTAKSASYAWADGVCSSVATWRTSLGTTKQDLEDGKVTKDALTGATDGMRTATQQLVDDLNGLGTPDLPSGQQAKKTVGRLTSELQSGTTKMRDAVDGASGAAGVLTAVSVVSGTLVTMGNEAKVAVDELRALDPKGELHDALAASDSCANLD